MCAPLHSSGPVNRLVRSLCTKEDAFTTLAQIVPSTVIAVFIFGLGMVFVVAQMIIPGRGSRSLSVIFRYVKIQVVVSFGLVLLFASIGMTGTANNDTNAAGGDPEGRPSHLDVASAVAFATILYVLVAFGCIIATFVSVMDPDRFRKRLDKRPLYIRVFARQWTSEQMYESLRIYRGWLRTVNRIGESRDLVFCVEGFLHLIAEYVTQIETHPRSAKLLAAPKARTRAGKLWTSRLDRVHTLNEGAVGTWVGLDMRSVRPAAVPTPAGTESHWFVDEVSRALVRAIESGLASGTLRRDLDRMLDIFDDAFMILARPNGMGAAAVQLRGDIKVLIRGITEVSRLVEHSTPEQRDWFVSVVLRIARYHRVISSLDSQSGSQWFGEISRQTLIGMIDAGAAYASTFAANEQVVKKPENLSRLCFEMASGRTTGIAQDSPGNGPNAMAPSDLLGLHSKTMSNFVESAIPGASGSDPPNPSPAPGPGGGS